MRRILHILILNLFFAVSLSAQNLSVSSFSLDETDLTANQHNTTVLDQNGDKCALIRVQTTQTGFTFDVGSLGVQKTIQKVGEIWLYVPHGVRKLTIRHQQLGTAMYSFPISVDKGRTYNMQLVNGEVQTIVKNAVTSQYVLFDVTPKDAVVEFDGEILNCTDGYATKRMPFGTYKYCVSAGLYHDKAGEVVVDNSENKHIVHVDLTPAFGYVCVPAKGSLEHANVYINDQLVGSTPFISNKLASGKYKIRVVKPLFSSSSSEVVVSDNDTSVYEPSLTAQFANVRFHVEDNAEIWINDEKKALSTWEGDLAFGIYNVECKKKGYSSSMTEIMISKENNGKTITLKSPTPQFGSLDITSTPLNAEIFIDGKSVGYTPMIINELLVGEHLVEIKKGGYEYRNKIEINQGQTFVVNESLIMSLPGKILMNFTGNFLHKDVCRVFAKDINNTGESDECETFSLELDCSIHDAEVSIYRGGSDKEEIASGNVNSVFILKKGNYYVTVARALFDDYSLKLKLNKNTRKNVKLTPIKNFDVNVIYNKDSSVYVEHNGDFRIIYPNGDLYKGGFEKNKRTGYGKYFYNNGEMVTGTWENDSIMYGEGTIFYDCQYKYEGEIFNRGLRHGYGLLYNNQDIVYSGRWENNERYIPLSEREGDVSEVFEVVEQNPSFPGGMDALVKYIGQNQKYPYKAQLEGIQGRVLVQFVVLKDGTIVMPKVVRSVNEELDEEALRIVSKMPKWIPAQLHGKPVSIRFTLPITFRLL